MKLLLYFYFFSFFTFLKAQICALNSQCLPSLSCKGNYCCKSLDPKCKRCNSLGDCNGCGLGYTLVGTECKSVGLPGNVCLKDSDCKTLKCGKNGYCCNQKNALDVNCLSCDPNIDVVPYFKNGGTCFQCNETVSYQTLLRNCELFKQIGDICYYNYLECGKNAYCLNSRCTLLNTKKKRRKHKKIIHKLGI